MKLCHAGPGTTQSCLQLFGFNRSHSDTQTHSGQERSRGIKCELHYELFGCVTEISPCLNPTLVIKHDYCWYQTLSKWGGDHHHLHHLLHFHIRIKSNLAVKSVDKAEKHCDSIIIKKVSLRQIPVQQHITPPHGICCRPRTRGEEKWQLSLLSMPLRETY